VKITPPWFTCSPIFADGPRSLAVSVVSDSVSRFRRARALLCSCTDFRLRAARRSRCSCRLRRSPPGPVRPAPKTAELAERRRETRAAAVSLARQR
jgi:hypothetical protein